MLQTTWLLPGHALSRQRSFDSVKRSLGLSLSPDYPSGHATWGWAVGLLLAEVDGHVQGFALFFHNYSTFLAQRGLYLEDLFVRPEARGRGVGKALLKALAELAVQRGCGRFEWSVLDWNQSAIDFYEAMGATVMPDWRICRVTGEALTRLGQPA